MFLLPHALQGAFWQPFQICVSRCSLGDLVPAYVGKFPGLLIGPFVPAFLVPREQVENPESSWLAYLLIKRSSQTGLTAEGISAVGRHAHRYGWYVGRMCWILWGTVGAAKPPAPSTEFSGTFLVFHVRISCSWKLNVSRES